MPSGPLGSPKMAHAPGRGMAPFCRHRTIPGCPDAYRRCYARYNPRPAAHTNRGLRAATSARAGSRGDRDAAYTPEMAMPGSRRSRAAAAKPAKKLEEVIGDKKDFEERAEKRRRCDGLFEEARIKPHEPSSKENLKNIRGR